MLFVERFDETSYAILFGNAPPGVIVFDDSFAMIILFCLLFCFCFCYCFGVFIVVIWVFLALSCLGLSQSNPSTAIPHSQCHSIRDSSFPMSFQSPFPRLKSEQNRKKKETWHEPQHHYLCAFLACQPHKQLLSSFHSFQMKGIQR